MANTNRERNTGNQGSHQTFSSGGSTATMHTPPTTASETEKGFASSVGDAAKSAAATVAEKASDAAGYVGKQVEGATSAVGGGMKSLAGTIREKLPHEGMLGSASGAIASTLESSGEYLQEHGLSGIGDDMTNVIRRNPIPAMLVCIGIGFLLARATRS